MVRGVLLWWVLACGGAASVPDLTEPWSTLEVPAAYTTVKETSDTELVLTYAKGDGPTKGQAVAIWVDYLKGKGFEVEEPRGTKQFTAVEGTRDGEKLEAMVVSNGGAIEVHIEWYPKK